VALALAMRTPFGNPRRQGRHLRERGATIRAAYSFLKSILG